MKGHWVWNNIFIIFPHDLCPSVCSSIIPWLNLIVTSSQSPPGLIMSPCRSFVPPVRDEEHEIQRKAHAKRVRETRRSTQGVTLEDLKSAEQLVKKKQQQENAQRTTELQQLAISSPSPGGSSPVPASPGSTATTTVTTSATLIAGGEADKQERRPSWRLRMESSDKNRVSITEYSAAQ